MAAWEKPKPSLVVGVVHTGQASMHWAQGYRLLRLSQPHTLIYRRGRPLDQDRELIAEEFLRGGAEHLFFLDSDLVPESPDLVERLLSHGLPLVCGVYWRRAPLEREGVRVFTPALWRRSGNPEAYNPLLEYPKDRLFQVDVAGLGLCLIHRSVLERVEPPRFLWLRSDVQRIVFQALEEAERLGGPGVELLRRRLEGVFLGRLEGLSEDFYFFEKARRAGFRVVVDPQAKAQHLTDTVIDGEGRLRGTPT